MVGFLFWFLVFCTLYVYFGYPFLLLIISRMKKLGVRERPEIAPFVTLIIAAHNEEQVIEKKIENALSQDYPKDKLQIVVASDASTDRVVSEERVLHAEKGSFSDSFAPYEVHIYGWTPIH